jgi:uncharacterized RDD family membrane protein YckC
MAMSNNRADLPDPSTAPELFDGVLLRRVLAYLLDVAILVAAATILGVISVILGFFTFGIPWVLLPVLIPALVLGYYAMTLGSPMRATVGMSVFDIVLVPARGYPLDGWKILIHPVVFWITVWVAWPISLMVALFTQRQQMVQDLVTGTIMLRRSPMVRHWAGART